MSRLVTKQEIKEKRKEILDKEFWLWERNCGICKKIPEAIENGTLYKTSWKDRKNPICDNCSAHNKIVNCGVILDELLKLERELR